MCKQRNFIIIGWQICIIVVIFFRKTYKSILNTSIVLRALVLLLINIQSQDK